MSKGSAVILLAVLIISIIITSGFVCASTAKPSAPEFTLKYVDNSYDVPPIATSTIDPYTGKQSQQPLLVTVLKISQLKLP